MLKHPSLALVLALSSLSFSTAFCAPGTSSHLINKTSALPTTPKSSLPLNQYGAIDAKATVSLAEQVPPLAADFSPPPLNALATLLSTLVPAPPNFEVGAYLLMDADSGALLTEFNANKRLPPASITKLMLIYLLEQQLKAGTLQLTDKVTVPEIAWATGGSRMFLNPNDSVTVEELVRGTLVDSGNDAAVTLAIHLAGSQDACVGLMNAEAARLGMSNTHFSDVMGLPVPNHYASARDLAILAKTMIQEFPEYQSWFSQKSFTYNKIKQYNFNKLLFIYPYADGLKTGSTQESGFSLLASAKMPDAPMHLISVLLGATSNEQSASNSKALLSYGFRFFENKLLYPSKTTLATIPLKSGSTKTIAVGTFNNLYVTFPKNQGNKLKAELRLNMPVVAPLPAFTPVGDVVITLDEKVILQVPLVTLLEAPKGAWWQRLFYSF